MKHNFPLFFFVIGLLLMQACQPKAATDNGTDSFHSGKVNIVADESFAPILDQEMYVFKALYKEAKPNLIYKSENDVLRLFLNDSIRVAIVALKLTHEEVARFKEKQLYPQINCFAYDGVTVIVNQSSKDTLTSVSELKDLLNGKAKTNKNIVFDNANSSLIRYLKEFSGNAQMKQKNIFALKSNVEVIKYVSEHADAIGFISYTWLLDPDKSYAPIVDKVKIVAVKDESNKRAPDKYFKPSQNTLAMRYYPLMRPLYIINNTGRAGLGTGFASFILGDGGQRIVLRAGLLPDSIPTREVSFGN